MNDKRIRIYNSARELFSAKGFKDTNVAEITKLAGVATGTFYNYYLSKDQLFMEIYLAENAQLKKHVLASIDLDEQPGKVIREMMLLNTQGMLANPILREWYNRDVFNQIERVYREQNGVEATYFLYDSFIEVVRKWQEAGKFRGDIDAEMIMAIFGAIINIDTHKEEIGLQYFPQILEYVTEFVINGLKGSGPSNPESTLLNDEQEAKK